MSDEIAEFPAYELIRLYRAGKLSPVEATQAALGRIEQHNAKLNAFCWLDAEAALASARLSEQRWRKGEPCGVLDGVPTSIKDLVLVKGTPTLRGSRTVSREQAWDTDAPSVARLREQGAVLLGKTTTPEFGWKGVTDSPLTGTTRNPYNAHLTPGGSSGGAAVAVACGMGPLAIGSDGGGSIRIPASFTGTYGFKPSFGRVPVAPLSPMGTLAHLGPMTRSVQDAALMMNVIAQPDLRDWHALPYDERDYCAALDEGVKGMRIAYSSNLGYAKVEPEVSEIVAAAVRVFSDLGAHVEERHPGFANPYPIFVKHWTSGAASFIAPMSAAQRELVDPGLLRAASSGMKVPLLDYLGAVYDRGLLGQAMNLFHRDYDLLVTPTMPVQAFRVGQNTPLTDDGGETPDWSPFTFPFNLTQQPAASIPCGFTRAGLPVGLQIVAARYADALVLRASRAFEMVRPIVLPRL
jgi:aspartyl-tRNA(Asn)/glutamyl-tRNA(Gln) amidotransferase subunit A